MKKFMALLIAAVLIVSMVGVLTAFAGASISGKSEVNAGKTYTYTGKVSYSGLDMVAKIEGLGQYATTKDDSGSDQNASLSASASIKITIPSSAKPGDTFKITLSGQYSYIDNSGAIKKGTISDSKTIKVVPVSAPRPSSSSGSSSHHAAAAATPTPPPTGWALAAIDVAAMAQGGQYDMEMADDTTVPAPVLAALKEKQGTLSVNFGSYSCTIDGAALGTLPEGLTGIDLGLSMETDAALSAAAGGADVYQLHFKHTGALPGLFSFRFKAEQSNPGDIVYLYYYYNASGVIEAKQQYIVDDEGYITVDIYHCSSYFLSNTLIEGAAGILTQPEPEPTLAAEPTEAPVSTPEAKMEGPAALNEGLAASASSPLEQWFGVPYAPLIAGLVAAALVSMLLTMLFTRSGLFKRRPKAAAEGFFAPDVPDVPAAPAALADMPEDVRDDTLKDVPDDTPDDISDDLE